MKVKRLTKRDWQSWKDLRLEALENAPEAFGSSYEEEMYRSDDAFQMDLERSDIFGVFNEDELVGCAGFYIMNSAKMKHRGMLYGVYIQPLFRGQGLASKLIGVVIEHAKSQVTQLHITCVTTNPVALKLYQKQGFIIYGTEPRSLKIGALYYDEYMMFKEL